MTTNLATNIYIIGSSYYFLIRYTETNEVLTKSSFIGPRERIKKLTTTKFSLRDTLLEFGPVKVTAVDLWSIIHPRKISAKDLTTIEKEVPGFKPGWLTDAVRTMSLKLKV